MQKVLRKLTDEQAYDSAMYSTLETVLSSHFTTRQTPHPECWYDCFKGLNKKIYVAMQGASEFTLGGELAKWSITDRLKVVSVPTLVMAGEFDTMSQECHQLVVDSIPTAWPLVTIPRAAHCKLLDEPQLCCDAMYKFLYTCEATRGMLRV